MNIVTSDTSGFIKLKRFYDSKIHTVQRLGKITRNADPVICQTRSESIFFFGTQSGEIHIKHYADSKLQDIFSFNIKNYIEEIPLPTFDTIAE